MPRGQSFTKRGWTKCTVLNLTPKLSHLYGGSDDQGFIVRIFASGRPSAYPPQILHDHSRERGVALWGAPAAPWRAVVSGISESSWLDCGPGGAGGIPGSKPPFVPIMCGRLSKPASAAGQIAGSQVPLCNLEMRDLRLSPVVCFPFSMAVLCIPLHVNYPPNAPAAAPAPTGDPDGVEKLRYAHGPVGGVAVVRLCGLDHVWVSRPWRLWSCPAL